MLCALNKRRARLLLCLAALAAPACDAGVLSGGARDAGTERPTDSSPHDPDSSVDLSPAADGPAPRDAALDTTLVRDSSARDATTPTDVNAPPADAAPADGAPAPAYPPQTALTAYAVPTQPKPAYLGSYVDKTFGTRVTRVTDKAAFGVPGDVVRHNYSKDQPWNSDGTLIYVGAGRSLLSDATYKRIGQVSASGELRWSNVDPLTMWNVDNGAATIHRLTITPGTPYTTTKTTLATLGEFDAIYLGPWEGNVADDDRYLALLGKQGDAATAVVWDLALNVEVSRKPLPEAFDEVDWISISPSGKYVVLQTNGKGTKIYQRDLTGQRQLIPGDGHADLGYDAAGKECIVHGVWFPHPIHVQIWSTPLDGSPATLQFNNTSYKDWNDDHVSMRAHQRPGWVYVSVNDNETGANKIEKHVFSLRLDGSGSTAGAEKVNQWVHAYSSSVSYDRLVFAVPNRDGTKVMFASDWGDPSGEVNSYVVELP